MGIIDGVYITHLAAREQLQIVDVGLKNCVVGHFCSQDLPAAHHITGSRRNSQIRVKFLSGFAL
jgi:hypothetical protein